MARSRPTRLLFTAALPLALALLGAWFACSRSSPLRAPAVEPGVHRMVEQAQRPETLETDETGTAAAAPDPAAPSPAQDPDPTRAHADSRPTRADPAPADPALAFRLVFTVTDRRGTPVNSLLRVDLEYAGKVAPAGYVPSLNARNGVFEVSIRDLAGSIRVYSTMYGEGSADFSAPVKGESHAEIVVSSLAMIRGRVMHEGHPVAGASVCLLRVRDTTAEQETRIACGDPPERCRWFRGELESGAGGEFQFAVDSLGDCVLVARHLPEGACTFGPVHVVGEGEQPPLVLELAAASRVEVRWAKAPPDPRLRVIALWGDNGIHANSPVGEADGLAVFEHLPAGIYEVVRTLQDFHGADPPGHVEVDGNAGTRVQHDANEPGQFQLSLRCGAPGHPIFAKLYRLGCCAHLVCEKRIDGAPLVLSAGDPGSYLLALEEKYGPRITYRRLMYVDLAAGTLELAPESPELSATLVCVTDRFDLEPHFLARSVLADGSQLFVQPRRGVPRTWLDPKSAPQPPKGKFLLGTELPPGTYDLVQEVRGRFVVLQSGVRVGKGAPTIVRL